jgi:HAMP domain-containing protein
MVPEVYAKVAPAKLHPAGSMNLLIRINTILGVALIAAGLILAYVCWNVLQANAKQAVLLEAGLMMDSALATRTYTSTEISPLLEGRMGSEFLPQSVPFYAATQNFLKLHAQHPAYTYKEAALNPTNPRDRATDWEADLIQQFRNVPSTREIIGERDTPMGKALYLARPISAESACLVCHANASTAPATLRARYGSDNGFGWQTNEVVGAHIVSVPLERATASALTTFRGIMIAIAIVLVSLLIVVNATVYAWVIRPIQAIVTVADELSVGNNAAGPFQSTGSREFAALTQAFERLRTSLNKALHLLAFEE